jgi:hypothetical protein
MLYDLPPGSRVEMSMKQLLNGLGGEGRVLCDVVEQHDEHTLVHYGHEAYRVESNMLVRVLSRGAQ